jgi:hypothetical protein
LLAKKLHDFIQHEKLCHWNLSGVRWIQSMPLYPIFVRSILTSSAHYVILLILLLLSLSLVQIFSEPCFKTPSQQHLTYQHIEYKLSYPCNRPWRPIGLWDVEGLTLSRQSAQRWQ